MPHCFYIGDRSLSFLVACVVIVHTDPTDRDATLCVTPALTLDGGCYIWAMVVLTKPVTDSPDT